QTTEAHPDPADPPDERRRQSALSGAARRARDGRISGGEHVMARAKNLKPKSGDADFVERRRAMGGLAFFRHMLEGQMPQAPMTKLLTMRLLEVDEGRVVFGARPTRDHYNGMGVVHGGLAATLLDSALGCAINSMAPPGKIYTTLELKINYTRPLT